MARMQYIALIIQYIHSRTDRFREEVITMVKIYSPHEEKVVTADRDATSK